MMATKEDKADVETSKSGRRRKKSAKLLEMEAATEKEKSDKSQLSRRVQDTVRGLRAALAPMTPPGGSKRKVKVTDPTAESPEMTGGPLVVKINKKGGGCSATPGAGGGGGASVPGALPTLKILLSPSTEGRVREEMTADVDHEEVLESSAAQTTEASSAVPTKKRKKKVKKRDSLQLVSIPTEDEIHQNDGLGRKKKMKKIKKIVNKRQKSLSHLDFIQPLGDNTDLLPSSLFTVGDDADKSLLSSDSLLPMYANTSEMALSVKTSAERKASKVKRRYRKKDDPLRPRKRRSQTAYMMWCSSYRQKVIKENPGIDFIQMSKRLGELWQALPEKQKIVWKRKAKKCAATGSMLISTGLGARGVGRKGATLLQSGKQAAKLARAAQRAAASTAAATARLTNGADVDSSFKVDCRPIDAAAHLTLLGESLVTIGTRLREHVGPCTVQGSVSVLLDSMICALGPLMCLTNEIPEMAIDDPRLFTSTLDNIAYIMPGIG